MVSKNEIIESLVRLLNHDDIDIIQSEMENEIAELYGDPFRYIENVPTGYKTITIRILNRKTHHEYIEKLKK